MILTLRSRLTLLYAAVFGVLLIALGLVSYEVLAYQLDADLSSRLTELTSGLHGYLRADHGRPALVFDPADAGEAAFVAEATRYYQVFEMPSGGLVLQSDALKPLALEFTPAEVRQFSERPASLDVRTDFGRIRLSNSVLSPGNGRTYLLQVGVSLAAMDRTLRRFLVLLGVGLPAGLLFTFLVGRWMTRVALMPLAHVGDAARTIDITDLGRRLPVRGAHDELDDVVVAFNDTLERLEHAVGEMRQFSTALAHELRTPLAALRGDIELAMLRPELGGDGKQRLAGQLEELDTLKRLIDQILMLARAESGELRLVTGAVDLSELAASLVDQLEPVAQAKGVELKSESTAGVIVTGDASWLERLVLNLLDNAIKFTPAGGHIVVRVSRDGAAARLCVADTGAGMTADMLPHVFERFFRGDPARSSDVEGAGLGLSLAKWIAERHHGRIDVESRAGQGSTFTVSLPLDRPSFQD